MQSQSAGFVLSVTTNSYTPYLIVGQNGPNPANDPVITGQQYQEVHHQLSVCQPGSDGCVSGSGYGRSRREHNHQHAHDSGPYRLRGAQWICHGQYAIPPGGQPAISPFDNVSISVESGLTNPELDAAMDERDDQISEEAIPQIPQGQTPDAATLATFNSVVTNRMISTTQSTAADFTSNSQVKTAGLNTGNAGQSVFQHSQGFCRVRGGSRVLRKCHFRNRFIER